MRWPVAAIGLAAGTYDESRLRGASGGPFGEEALPPQRELQQANPQNPIDVGELAVLTGQADPKSYANVPDGCGSDPLVYIKEWQSQFMDGCSGIVTILNTKFHNHHHPEYDADWRINSSDPDALWRLARRTMTAPGRIAYSITGFNVGLRIGEDMLNEMTADPTNAADALALAVSSTLPFPPGLVRVAGTDPDFGAVGAFNFARRLGDAEEVQAAEAVDRRLSGQGGGKGGALPAGQKRLAVFYEVATPAADIATTQTELATFKGDSTLISDYQGRVAQFAQSMVLTCTINCADVFDAIIDPQNRADPSTGGFPTKPYDPTLHSAATGVPGTTPYVAPGGYNASYSSYSASNSSGYGQGAKSYYYNANYSGYSSYSYLPPTTAKPSYSYVPPSNYSSYSYVPPTGNGSTPRLLQNTTFATYAMANENDVVTFILHWKDANPRDCSDEKCDAFFSEYLFDPDGGEYHQHAVDALSVEAAMAWYQVGGCPTKGLLPNPISGDHPYNDLKGFCLQECCGCKLCEDYYAGKPASNQTVILAEFESFCLDHERSCMSGECSMCGPCFGMCSYDETEIDSDGKAFLSFVAAAKAPAVQAGGPPTLCKMCCHMDMPAVAEVWDGIPQCLEGAKKKAIESMGCAEWDWKVSCTCEKDFWMDSSDDAMHTGLIPAVFEDDRKNAEFCRNAVTYWVSVYHCNDVYATLSRDQPAFATIVERAGLKDEVDLLPSEERPSPSLCDICGATCAFNFEGACQCPLPDGPPADEKYAMLVFGGLIGMFLFVTFYDFCVPRPVA